MTYVAPARRLYRVAHIRADDTATACGLATDDPDELWVELAERDVETVCPSCTRPREVKELTLL